MKSPAPLDKAASVLAVPVSTGNNRISQFLAATSQPNSSPHGATEVYTDTQQINSVVAANATIVINATGISFYFGTLPAAAGLNVRAINAGQTRSTGNYVQGTGLRYGTQGFQKLEITNPSAAQVAFTLIVGGGVPNNTYDEFIDKRVIVTNNPSSNVLIQTSETVTIGFATRTPAWADTLAAGASQIVTENYLGYQRKSIIFSNDDAAAVLLVLDANGNTIGSVQPSTAWTTDTGGTITLKNPSGGNVICHIGEVYYT